MKQYRYTLEPYKGMQSRYHCPICQHRRKTFTRYIETETGNHIAPEVGKCNRENNCGYHYTPKQYFEQNGIVPTNWEPKPPPPPKPTSFIPVELFNRSLKGYANNHFVKFLTQTFGAEIASQLISRYFIGSSKYWEGANIFWQIDIKGKVRTGKIMLYKPETGKRVKEPYDHVNWVHKRLKQPDFGLKQCLFGEHLLNLKAEEFKPVAIVESEKTAIIASIYLPQFLWLAVGSLNNLNAEKCEVLTGRNVVLFPDLKGFDKWNNKAKELCSIAPFIVSDLLERKAPEAEKGQGLDLADYLLRFDYQSFIAPKSPAKVLLQPLQPSVFEEIPEAPQPEKWDKNIQELEAFFSSVSLPNHPIKFNQYSTINSLQAFIESHFEVVKHNNGKRAFLPYLNRLEELKQFLSNNI